jgi:hypothetical protein
MLSTLGKLLAKDGHDVVKMVNAVDLIDMELEGEVFNPPGEELDINEAGLAPMRVLESELPAITFREAGDVDDKDPPPLLTLFQFKDMSERLFAFASDNSALVTQAGT